MRIRKAAVCIPLVTLERISDAPKLSLELGSRPLENINVLEMTRVLAGPVCGRTPLPMVRACCA